MNKITIYTDGSSKGNPGPGGWGAIISSQHPVASIKEIGGREEKTTNNRMEMVAVIKALGFVQELTLELTPAQSDGGIAPELTLELIQEQVEIHTDSAYLLNGITKWVFGWQKNGWLTKDKKEVLNKDLWQKLVQITEEKNIGWEKVKGHSGHKFNERCDIIATSFADSEPVELFEGNSSDYEKIISAVSYGNKGKAYSYVSMVGGIIQTHSTWTQCETRVKGKKARFKKALSKDEEENIIKEFKK